MLDEIRRKPKDVRERYAFWSAVGITGVISLVWLVAFVTQFKDGGPFSDIDSSQTAGAFSQFFDGLKNDASNIFPNREDFIVESEVNSVDEKKTENKSATTTDKEFIIEKNESSANPVLIGTTTKRSVQVGTTSEQNR